MAGMKQTVSVNDSDGRAGGVKRRRVTRAVSRPLSKVCGSGVRDQSSEVDQSGGVSPFVVVPADYLDEAS